MRRHKDEKDFSAAQHSQEKDSRLQGPHGNQGRSQGHQKKTQKGQKETHALTPDFSLPRRERIRSRQVFNQVLRSGRWVASKYFAIYYLEAPTRAAGFTVSRKVRGKPRKNRIKRRLRELYRLNKNLLPPSGFFIFMGLPAALEADFDTLQKTFQKLARKLAKSSQERQ